MIISLDNLNKQ